MQTQVIAAAAAGAAAPERLLAPDGAATDILAQGDLQLGGEYDFCL